MRIADGSCKFVQIVGCDYRHAGSRASARSCSKREDFNTRLRDQNRMFPLSRKRMIFSNHRPAIGKQSHLTLPSIHHGLDRECHSRYELHAATAFAIVKDLWILVEDASDTMATIFPNHAVVLSFNEVLNRRADVSYASARFHFANPDPHSFVGDIDQTLCGGADLTHREHAAGIAVPAIFDDGDVDVDDIALLQSFIAGDSVTDDMIDLRTDGFGKPAIIERSRNRLLRVDYVVMEACIDLASTDAWYDVRADHGEDVRREPPRSPHL